jgi:C-terminal processing protease CtpA/Prc
MITGAGCYKQSAPPYLRITMWPLVFSILIHALLLGTLVLRGSDGEGGSGQSHIKLNIADKVSEDNKIKISIKETPLDDKSKVTLKKKESKPKQEYIDHKCKDYYSGIGVQHSGVSCLITHVGKGYPADRAGVKVGDLTMKTSSGDCPGRGPLGTPVTIKVMRGSQVLTFHMIREKICGTAYLDTTP